MDLCSITDASLWYSIDSLSGGGSVPSCSIDKPYELVGGEQKVAYTYSVIWRVRAAIPMMPQYSC